jgi:hypothetical protein
VDSRNKENKEGSHQEARSKESAPEWTTNKEGSHNAIGNCYSPSVDSLASSGNHNATGDVVVELLGGAEGNTGRGRFAGSNSGSGSGNNNNRINRNNNDSSIIVATAHADNPWDADSDGQSIVDVNESKRSARKKIINLFEGSHEADGDKSPAGASSPGSSHSTPSEKRRKLGGGGNLLRLKWQ